MFNILLRKKELNVKNNENHSTNPHFFYDGERAYNWRLFPRSNPPPHPEIV